MIDSTSPWNLTVNKNVQAGYIDIICIKCNNAEISATYDEYVI